MSGSEACVGGVDVPEAPFVYMCQASLVVRGHRMGVILKYRHHLVPSVRLWHGSA